MKAEQVSCGRRGGWGGQRLGQRIFLEEAAYRVVVDQVTSLVFSFLPFEENGNFSYSFLQVTESRHKQLLILELGQRSLS